MAQRTVDIHNHYYPVDYIKHLLGRTGKTKAVQTGPHSYVMKASDVIVAHIDRPGHYDLAARIADLDKAGMDTQVVSKTIPGPDMLERDEGVYWAKRINDALAEATQKYPHRLYAYACLPYQDVDEFLQGTDALPEGARIQGNPDVLQRPGRTTVSREVRANIPDGCGLQYADPHASHRAAN